MKSVWTPSGPTTLSITTWTAYALAYGIASLLNNLFGKGKEPFWQQAYTNLIKFIIILHKVGFGYVTLFDVYESAISPEVLERKMKEAEQDILGKCFLGVSRELFQQHAPKLAAVGFEADETGQTYRVTDSAASKRSPSETSRRADCPVRSPAEQR